MVGEQTDRGMGKEKEEEEEEEERMWWCFLALNYTWIDFQLKSKSGPVACLFGRFGAERYIECDISFMLCHISTEIYRPHCECSQPARGLRRPPARLSFSTASRPSPVRGCERASERASILG